MAAKTFGLKFDGYWREENILGIPSNSGVYCVYECRYNPQKDTVSILELIYIGEAGDVNDRIKNHKKWKDWEEYVGEGNELCFSFTYVESAHRDRVEAALIFEHKPPVNEEYKYSFPFDTTSIKASGKTALLNSNFTVYKTE